MSDQREVVAYPAEAVLDIKAVAKWLGVSVRMVERLNLPCVMLGTRTRRYTGKAILEYLAKKEAA